MTFFQGQQGLAGLGSAVIVLFSKKRLGKLIDSWTGLVMQIVHSRKPSFSCITREGHLLEAEPLFLIPRLIRFSPLSPNLSENPLIYHLPVHSDEQYRFRQRRLLICSAIPTQAEAKPSSRCSQFVAMQKCDEGELQHFNIYQSRVIRRERTGLMLPSPSSGVFLCHRKCLSYQHFSASVLHLLDEGPHIDIQTEGIGDASSKNGHHLVP